ncbi:MAG: hypothetical protein VX939_11440 [Pseudomonadota bacterium]|nr:hypothetical protein [Pseudomonadota bacterium]
MTEPEYIPAGDQRSSNGDESGRNLVVVVYILQALAFFLGGVTALVGVIINYVKLDDVKGSWIEPHFRWQIKTFWIGLLWTVIGIVTTPILVGWLVLLGISIWVIYRIVKGALALNDGKSPL